ncbi:MAG TPA: hypothetical protein VGF28_15550 [Thermoanaerobaculia bacterium]|jgi:hypothetical protein
MSYLHPVRLHFAGQFQADVSTVNNTTQYYDNATFEKKNQQRGVPFGTLGAWNPEGSNAWRLVGCVVTRVCYADGTSSTDPNADPVIGLRIADTNKRVAGKLVDLDPEQQMVSQIWSLLVRLTDGDDDAFSGPFETAAFTNLWRRSRTRTRPPQQPLAAIYQSVLAPVTWGNTRGSRFLRELRETTAGDMLSIKFNVDGYERDWTLPNFTFGRIAGTIGPAAADEPHHFVLGRQLGSDGSDARMTFLPCVIDSANARIIADFGNSIQTEAPGSEAGNSGTITLGWLDPATQDFNRIADVPYREEGWYTSTAGVQAYPLDRPLSSEELSTLASAPLAVAIDGKVVLTENPEGIYVRADDFVYRLAPGDTAAVQLYATRYGKLHDGEAISVSYDPSRLQIQVGPGDPPVGQPVCALTGFDPAVPLVAKDGRATLTLVASDPENPRGYVDGQVYGVRPLAQALAGNPAAWVNPSDFISVLVWDEYTVPDAPAWFPDMQPIFTQYGNLYPLMDKLIDLTSYDAVAAHADVLAFVFGLPVEDPNSMPVTRDLSPKKREAVLKWLKAPGPDGKPLWGTRRPVQEAATVARAVEVADTRDELFFLKSGVSGEKEG